MSSAPTPATPRDIVLTPEDREALLHDIAAAFHSEAATRDLLQQIGYSSFVFAHPSMSSRDRWNTIFTSLDGGRVPQGYRRLLEAALRVYNRNQTFNRLHQRYVTSALCHVIVHLSGGVGRVDAYNLLQSLDLDPYESYATDHVTCLRVESSDPEAVRSLLRQARLDWTVVPPGESTGVLAKVRLEGPDGAAYELAAVPLASTVDEIATALASEFYPAITGAVMITHVGGDGSSRRLHPEQTLHQAGVNDGDTLRIGTFSIVGGAGTPPPRGTTEAPRSRFAPLVRATATVPAPAAGPDLDDDQVQWQVDAPTADDRLNRAVLADAIAGRLRRLFTEERQTFLMLLDGRWGSGKSSVNQMVIERLERDRWVVATYDAWRHARINHPWWTLLTTVRQAVYGAVPRWRRPLLRLAEIWQMRVTRTPAALAGLLIVLCAAGLFLLLRPDTLSLSSMAAGLQTAAAIAAAAGAVWAGAVVSARFLLWGSLRGARFFEQTAENPLSQVAEHLSWLISRVKRPLLLVIDDLDRCRAGEVVQVLETVQTLLREPSSQRSPVAVLVSADAAWLHTAFDREYQDLGEAVTRPGQTVGHLFCDKIFQLVVPMPAMGPHRRARFLAMLLGSQAASGSAPSGQEVRAARARLDASGSEAEVLRALDGMSPQVREEVGAKAAEVLNRTEVQQHTEHALERFAPLLAANPRSIKRFVNDYSMARTVRALEGDPVPVSALAQWTAIRVRWPALAEFLREHPETFDDDKLLTDDLRNLWTDADLRLAVSYLDHPLTADLVRRCCGQPFAGL